MKTTLKKILTICISLLSVIKIDAQSTEWHIYGVWTLLSSKSTFKFNTINRFELPNTDVSEYTKVVFLKNGIGYTFLKDNIANSLEFGWKLKNDTIEIQEDVGISWWDKFHIKYKSSKSTAHLFLDQTYRRQTYKELYCLENEKIRLRPLSDVVLAPIESSDIDLANANKLITEQVPIVTNGIYDSYAKTLYIEKNIYKQLLRLKGQVQIDMFVKNYIKEKPHSLASYLITYYDNTLYANFIKDYSNSIKYFLPV